jgi:hypothetical protein
MFLITAWFIKKRTCKGGRGVYSIPDHDRLRNLYSSSHIIMVTKTTTMIRAGHTTEMRKMRNAHSISFISLETVDLRETGCQNEDWTQQ